MSYYKAALGAIDDKHRNFEPWSSDDNATCELAPPLLTSTPTGGRSRLDRFNVQWTLLHSKSVFQEPHPTFRRVSYNSGLQRVVSRNPRAPRVTIKNARRNKYVCKIDLCSL
ncbi:hypothetical protein TNCV_3495311 [Trichonephila clavipes]|nr:hypothetical protein TNCV_3495311 [Trichonephila clavipes]